MKKLLAVLLASFVLLTACSSNSGSNANSESANDSGKKEITIWAWDPNFNIAALELAKEAYAAKNPDVTINIVEYAQDDIIQKLNTGLNSGTTKGLPDIVLIEDYRAQGFLQAYPDSFYDMSSSINASDFADYKIGPTSYNGKQYGVPFDSSVTGLYVRTDYLEQAGYSIDDLQDITWNDLIEIGKKVKEATGKNLVTLDPNDLGLVRTMLQSAGSWYTKEDGSTPDLAGNAALKEAFETYKAIMDADIVTMNSDWSQMVGQINNGEVSTVPTGNWFTPSIKAAEDQSGKWAIAPLPKLSTNSSVHASNLGGSSWYVMSGDNQEAAADFLAQTFGSDVDLYQDLVTKVGAIGTLKAATSGEAYKAADEYFGGQTTISDFAKWTEEIPNVNYGMHTYAIEDILVVEMQNYLNGKDIDSVLNDAQKTAEAQLK